MNRKYWVVVAILLILLAIDQWVKIYIKSNFEPNVTRHVFGNWFALNYTENYGMAFGTTLGRSIYGKLALSVFRIVAIAGIAYYIWREVKKQIDWPQLIALTMILAGATGNLIDSMCYDFIFPFNPCDVFNKLEGSGITMNCVNEDGINPVEVRNKGFMFGNVVDMFMFDVYWPTSMPWLGGKLVFPAIWNVADSCISVGVGLMILINRKSLFSFKKASQTDV